MYITLFIILRVKVGEIVLTRAHKTCFSFLFFKLAFSIYMYFTDFVFKSPKFVLFILRQIYLSTANGALYARREHFKRLVLYNTRLKETH